MFLLIPLQSRGSDQDQSQGWRHNYGSLSCYLSEM